MNTASLNLSGSVPMVTLPAQELLDLFNRLGDNDETPNPSTPTVEYFHVGSRTNTDKFYTVTSVDSFSVACTCPAWVHNNHLGANPCKHMRSHRPMRAAERIKDLED